MAHTWGRAKFAAGYWLLAVLLLYSRAAETAAQKKDAPQFSSAFMAMLSMPDLGIIKTYYFNMLPTLTSDDTFKPLIDIASSPEANATYFWPVDTAWDALSQQVCLSVPQILNIMKSFTPIAAGVVKINTVPGKTLMSDDFKTGMELQTLNSTFTLPLTLQTKANGEDQWIFPGLAFNRSNVTIVRTNITAGNSVIHFTDTAIYDEGLRQFWNVQKELACAEKNATPATPAGNSGDSKLPPGIIAAIAIPCAIAVSAILAIAIIFAGRRQLFKQFSKGRDQCTESGADGTHPVLPGSSQQQPPDPPRLGSESRPAYTIDSASSVQGMPALADAPVDSEDQEPALMPAFEPTPVVAPAKLKAWLAQDAQRGGDTSTGGPVCGGATTGSSAAVLRFSEKLRRELDPQEGNPNISNNYTNLTQVSLHANTAVYFADGLHNPRQYAIKFYADPEACAIERSAYRELQGAQNKYIPVLEVAYIEPADSPFTSFCAFERGSYSLDTLSQQQPNYYKLIDVFHQLLCAVQYFHDHGRVHRDMKPQNVVYFPDRSGGAWMLIDLATSIKIGEKAKIVYTRDYCAPEVAQAVLAGQVTCVTPPAADLWGVGVIMYELITGQRYFPRSWSDEGRIWSALGGFERLPSELRDITALPGVDPSFRGLMRQVRRLLHRNPEQRPTPRQLLSDRLFQARNTTTQVSQGSNLSHGSQGSLPISVSTSQGVL